MIIVGLSFLAFSVAILWGGDRDNRVNILTAILGGVILGGFFFIVAPGLIDLAVMFGGAAAFGLTLLTFPRPMEMSDGD